MNEILTFIKNRWTVDDNWTSGNCYWFAHILCTRFPYLKIYYDAAPGHFVAGDGINFYDWNGIYVSDTVPILFSQIENDDKLWYSRLQRDCIE